jgi:hypothetical protein
VRASFLGAQAKEALLAEIEAVAADPDGAVNSEGTAAVSATQ